jgi:hypothetical protein
MSGKGTPTGGQDGTEGSWTGTGGGGAGRDGVGRSSDGSDGLEGEGRWGSTDFLPAIVTTGGGISSSLTARPEWACFRRSLSILMPRPNLEYGMNYKLFITFSILPEKNRDEER